MEGSKTQAKSCIKWCENSAEKEEQKFCRFEKRNRFKVKDLFLRSFYQAKKKNTHTLM